MSDDRKKSSYRQLHFVKRHFLPLGLGFLFMQIIASLTTITLLKCLTIKDSNLPKSCNICFIEIPLEND